MESNTTTVEAKHRPKLRILVADDEAPIRDILKEFLEGEGHTVELVENGRLLVDKLSEKGNNYDLVITDNTMPVKKGIEAIRDIRAMGGKLEKLPIILLTGDGTPSDELAQTLKNLNATYFGKPFKFGELLKIVEDVTKKDAVSSTE